MNTNQKYNVGGGNWASAVAKRTGAAVDEMVMRQHQQAGYGETSMKQAGDALSRNMQSRLKGISAAAEVTQAKSEGIEANTRSRLASVNFQAGVNDANEAGVDAVEGSAFVKTIDKINQASMALSLGRRLANKKKYTDTESGEKFTMAEMRDIHGADWKSKANDSDTKGRWHDLNTGLNFMTNNLTSLFKTPESLNKGETKKHHEALITIQNDLDKARRGAEKAEAAAAEEAAADKPAKSISSRFHPNNHGQTLDLYAMYQEDPMEALLASTEDLLGVALQDLTGSPDLFIESFNTRQIVFRLIDFTNGGSTV